MQFALTCRRILTSLFFDGMIPNSRIILPLQADIAVDKLTRGCLEGGVYGDCKSLILGMNLNAEV